MISGLNVSCISSVPTSAQIARFLPHGGTIRQVEGGGWHQVEQTKGKYALTAQSQQLYAAVAEAGAANLVTLAFGNKLYTPNNMTFPTDPASQAAFARYAVWMVTNVPNLAAISIWNEYNGSFGTGTPQERQAHYAALLQVVVPAIRAANPNVKIIAGATVGWNVDGWYRNLNKLYDLQLVDGIDCHPYFGPDKLDTWAQKIMSIRNSGIKNPCYLTEHGGPIAVKLGEDYWSFFHQICDADPISTMGSNYFLLQNSGKFNSGLLENNGAETVLGESWHQNG